MAENLNVAVKRLKKQINAKHAEPHTVEQWYDYLDEKVKPAFLKIYNADTTMAALNADSMRIMLRLNVRFRIVPFHQFGLFIPD
jgi:hypothetical protein